MAMLSLMSQNHVYIVKRCFAHCVLQVSGRRMLDKIYNVKDTAQRSKVIDPNNPDLSKQDAQGSPTSDLNKLV